VVITFRYFIRGIVTLSFTYFVDKIDVKSTTTGVYFQDFYQGARKISIKENFEGFMHFFSAYRTLSVEKREERKALVAELILAKHTRNQDALEERRDNLEECGMSEYFLFFQNKFSELYAPEIAQRDPDKIGQLGIEEQEELYYAATCQLPQKAIQNYRRITTHFTACSNQGFLTRHIKNLSQTVAPKMVRWFGYR
jgi:hypothetical protein